MEKILSRNKENNLILNYFLGYTLIYPLILEIIAIFISTFFKNFDNSLFVQGIMVFMFLGYVLLYAKNVYLNALYFIKNNWRYLIKNIFKMFFIMLFINLIVGNLINFFFKIDSSNQQLIMENVKKYPFIMFFMIIVFAPLVEELIFREIIYKKLWHKYNGWIALTFSSLLFAFVHVIPDLFMKNYAGTIFIVQYFLLGIFLGYIYGKHKNIASSIILHAANNIFAAAVLYLVSGGL